MRSQNVALVTGGTGFIGSNLIRGLIYNGWSVHAIVRPKSSLKSLMPFIYGVNIHEHDGSTENLVAIVAALKIDVVFHLASTFLSDHGAENIEPLIQSNVLFGNQLLEAMRINDVKCIVNTGTSWQHYNNETYNPVCLYAATKQAFEAILEYYIKACKFQVITLKIFDTYGPNDPRKKLFYFLHEAAESGIPLNMSAGEQLIDLVHINDVVEAYLIASKFLLEKKITQHEYFSVSSGQALQLRQLVEFYATVMCKDIKVNWGGRPYRLREVMMPWTKGNFLPDWRPKTSLKDGISQLI